MDNITEEKKRISTIRELVRNNDFERGSQHCLEALSQTPDSPQFKFLLAICEDGRGRPDEAKRQLRTLLGQRPDFYEARYELGRLLLVEGHTQEAKECFKGCLEQNPNHAPSYTALGRLDYAKGDLEQADQQLRTALRADADYVPALTTLAALSLERVDHDQANDYASRALTLAPESPAAQLAMGQVMLARGYLDFAEQCLSNAAASDPQNPRLHFALASLLRKRERHQEALAALGQAERLGLAGPSLERAKIQSLVNLGRLDEALRNCSQLLDQSGPDQATVIALSDIQVALGDIPGLSDLLERLPETSQDLRFWVGARLALARRDVQAALQALEKAESLAAGELARRVRLLAAELLLDKGKARESVEALRALAEDARSDTQLAWQLARLARQAGHYGFSVSILQSLLDHGQVGQEVRARTAVMLVDLHDLDGNFEQAANGFEAAAWQPPYLGDPQSFESPESIDFDRLVPWSWRFEPWANGRPIFLSGWPCSGRDLLLDSLVMAGLTKLPPADWPARQEKLALSAEPAVLARLDDTSLRLMRKRYLRATRGQPDVIEPGPIFARQLPMIARAFPGAIVVVPVAREQYLTLQWRLFGYRQVPTMRKAWAQERSLLQRMQTELPLQFMEVDLDQLLANTEETLQNLVSRLDGAWRADISERVRALSLQRGYRSPDHWRHYSAILD